MLTSKPVVLAILDGWGIGEQQEGNAPKLAQTPNFDRLMHEAPNSKLITHGPDAGLPIGQMGNSEVGHMNIGAGRVVSMDLGRIDLAIEEGSFSQRQPFIEFVTALQKTGGHAHLFGLLSNGGVHSNLDHMIAAANALSDENIPVFIHAICDGRDVGPKTAGDYLDQLEKNLPENAVIASLIGRYFAMDRDNRWERVSSAYQAIVHGEGRRFRDAEAALSSAYDAGKTDEFIDASIMGNYAGMAEGDGLFCLNFRADRAREILSAILDPSFKAFSRKAPPDLAARLGMVSYSSSHDQWLDVLFPKENILNTLGSWVSKAGKRQFRLAETEKYPHVTFFLNGGKEEPEIGEERYMAASPKVATYDLAPEMASEEVSDQLVAAIGSGFDLIVVNFANPDMVGHTGDLNAAIKACEAVDRGLGKALAALEAAEGVMIVTADHGNCEQMIDPETGGVHTAHTTNLVPVALAGTPLGTKLKEGRLADLAPTLLDLMGLENPEEMTGQSLIIKP